MDLKFEESLNYYRNIKKAVAPSREEATEERNIEQVK